MIHVAFACGHAAEFKSEGQRPRCPACGEKRIAGVVAPPPRIVGTASGPLVETKPLEAMPVSLTQKEPDDGNRS